MLRHESLRAVFRLTWPEVAFQQAVIGYSSRDLFLMNTFINSYPDLFKFGIPYPWEEPFATYLKEEKEGALLLDDLAKRIEGDEPIKP